ncbi:MAG: nitronate monooxygenase [Fimbriimonadaceae bacterium]|nr:nitronate monooxygenase [Fimbriimonadaceae bacterium]
MAKALEDANTIFSGQAMNLPPIPIWQAPTGSTGGPKLAAAISAAGGVGAMGLTWTDPEIAADWVTEVRSSTSNPFYVNFVLAFEPIALDAVLDAGAPIITFSWGSPAPFVDRVRRSGARLGIQVFDRESILHAIQFEPDFLVVQGIEAGGHVQSRSPLGEALMEAKELAQGIPILAAGGISTREHIQETLGMGADGVILGTRFLATVESKAHQEYKALLVAHSETSLTKCFDGGWPNAPHRVLRNSTFDTWQRAFEPLPDHRPGEGRVVAKTTNGDSILRYEMASPQEGMEGEIEAMCLYAGTGVREIRGIPTVADLLAELWP